MPSIVSGVDVTLAVEQGAAPLTVFGRGLTLRNVTTAVTAEAEVKLNRGVRSYNNAAAVQTAGEVKSVQDAATVWFSGTIEPQSFLVATQFGVAQPRMVYGDSFSVTAAEANGDGYTLNMGSRTLSIDLDTLTTAAQVAQALETALNNHADISGAVVSVIDSDRLQIQLPADLTGSVAFDATADDLGLGPADTVTEYEGIAAAETATAALTRVIAINSDFTYIALPTDAYNDIASVETKDQRIEALAAWAEANDRIFNFADYGTQVLAPNETLSASAKQLALTRTNVAGDYTGTTAGLLPYGVQTVMSAVEFTLAGSARNVANRRIPGVAATVLTDAEASELDRKRMNYYRKEGNLQHVRGGRTFGEWYETAVFLLWLKNQVALAAFNYKQSLERFIANDVDYAGLRRAIEVPLRQGLDAGFISPGVVSDAVRNRIRSVTGNRTFDGELSEGYLVWNAPASTTTAAQLSNRESLPVYFWAKGSQMINEINIDGNYAR